MRAHFVQAALIPAAVALAGEQPPGGQQHDAAVSEVPPLEPSARRGQFREAPGGHDWKQWNAQLEAVFASLRQHLG